MPVNTFLNKSHYYDIGCNVVYRRKTKYNGVPSHRLTAPKLPRFYIGVKQLNKNFAHKYVKEFEQYGNKKRDCIVQYLICFVLKVD